MSGEKKEEAGEKKLSFDEIMAQIKDPAMLHAAAAKFGLKFETPKPAERKERKLPKIELAEDASPADMIKALNEQFANLVSYVNETAEEKASSVRGEFKQKEDASLGKKIRDFAKSKTDFNDVLPMTEIFFNTGNYTIEEAYELGKKASGKGTAEPGAGKTEKSVEPGTEGSLSKTSEEDGTRSRLEAKPGSTRDTAKKTLDTLLASGKFADALGESDEIE